VGNGRPNVFSPPRSAPRRRARPAHRRAGGVQRPGLDAGVRRRGQVARPPPRRSRAPATIRRVRRCASVTSSTTSRTSSSGAARTKTSATGSSGRTSSAARPCSRRSRAGPSMPASWPARRCLFAAAQGQFRSPPSPGGRRRKGSARLLAVDDSIRSWADVKGKRIAYQRGTSLEAGCSPPSRRPVSHPPTSPRSTCPTTSSRPPLESGSADAAISAEPLISAYAQNHPGARTAATADEITRQGHLPHRRPRRRWATPPRRPALADLTTRLVRAIQGHQRRPGGTGPPIYQTQYGLPPERAAAPGRALGHLVVPPAARRHRGRPAAPLPPVPPGGPDPQGGGRDQPVRRPVSTISSPRSRAGDGRQHRVRDRPRHAIDDATAGGVTTRNRPPGPTLVPARPRRFAGRRRRGVPRGAERLAGVALLFIVWEIARSSGGSAGHPGGTVHRPDRRRRPRCPAACA
jgi:hypothetical protein